MIGFQQLYTYIAQRFLVSIVGMFAGCTTLIFMIDFIDVLRKSSSADDIGLFTLVKISLFKVPSLSEQLLPFAVLFGSIAAFLSLSRKSELVVARAAGISVWQITMPGVIVAFLLGLVAVGFYNPLSAYLKEERSKLESNYLGQQANTLFGDSDRDIWLRQDGVDGPSVIHAKRSLEKGTKLFGFVAFVFDKDHKFVERIEAKEAELKAGFWDLKDAWVIATELETKFYQNYSLSTFLDATQVQDSIADPEQVSFWELPKFVETSEKAGLSATAFRLRWYELTARPLYMVAMVIIAATVAMRVYRFGNIGRMIVGGIVAGFILFVFSKLLGDISKNDILPPILAGWLPGFIGTLAGISILLYQEDG